MAELLQFPCELALGLSSALVFSVRETLRSKLRVPSLVAASRHNKVGVVMGAVDAGLPASFSGGWVSYLLLISLGS